MTRCRFVAEAFQAYKIEHAAIESSTPLRYPREGLEVFAHGQTQPSSKSANGHLRLSSSRPTVFVAASLSAGYCKRVPKLPKVR